MAAITPTIVSQTPLAAKRILILTATIESSSDTITLTKATHGVETLYAVTAVITAGLDAAFSYLQVSHSGLVITVASFEQDGTVATDFTGTTIELICIVD